MTQPRGPRVLLVDDEAAFLETLAKRLRAREMEVRCVGDGSEALVALASEPADVVVLDVRMPGMGGLETLRGIKRDFPAVEVIILTGHGDMETALAGMRLGVYDYLIKPVDIDRLTGDIEAAAAGRGSGEPSVRNDSQTTEEKAHNTLPGTAASSDGDR